MQEASSRREQDIANRMVQLGRRDPFSNTSSELLGILRQTQAEWTKDGDESFDD